MLVKALNLSSWTFRSPDMPDNHRDHYKICKPKANGNGENRQMGGGVDEPERVGKARTLTTCSNSKLLAAIKLMMSRFILEMEQKTLVRSWDQWKTLMKPW